MMSLPNTTQDRHAMNDIDEKKHAGNTPVLKRIVIVGGGAGGLELATALGNSLGKTREASITLVDRNHTHIWKPLLHEVAAGSLDASKEELSYAAQAKWHHFSFTYGDMEGVDRKRRVIRLAAWKSVYTGQEVPAVEVPYDVLVIAVGSVCNDFGTPGVLEHCVFLDSRLDAERLRQEMLEHRLIAVARGTPLILKVAIVGGGATGVELCAELRDANRKLAHYDGRREGIDDIDLTLLEAGPRLLPALPERISASVAKELRDLGITVLTDSAVKRVVEDGLYDANGNKVPADLMVWAAGIRAPDFLQHIEGLDTNRLGQLQVHRTLQTTNDPNIFAFGDCAACPLGSDEKQTVPPRAQAAHQQATLLAANLRRLVKGQPLVEFDYHDHGSLVSLASYNTVGNLLGNRVIEGWVAHFFYASLYRMHQSALLGQWRVLRLMLGSLITRNTRPLLKLH
jgi:NADH:ubiquinone reductase (H+-translocating)